VPRLWNETIDEHRRVVRDAILDSTAALVGEHGLRAVTMSQIAADTGIGRATLYKYFPDLDAILLAWHERQITGHLEQLAQIRDQARDVGERLEAVLERYALIHQVSLVIIGMGSRRTAATRSLPCCIAVSTSREPNSSCATSCETY
jgi:AcrR family transcriptional regulator